MLKHKSLYEILFKTKPVYSQLKVFDYLAFATTLINGRHKFDSRVGKCIFLGYPFGIKGYKLSDLEKHEISFLIMLSFMKIFFLSKSISRIALLKRLVFYQTLVPYPAFISLNNYHIFSKCSHAK